MSSNNKRLKTAEASLSVIELDSLPEAKQQEFLRLRRLMASMRTDEDARNVFETLRASPDFARVVEDDGDTLLHCACKNRVCKLEMIQFIVDLFPQTLRL